MKSFLESPKFIFLFLLLILTSWGAVLYFRLYYLIWWLDAAHHFLGGLWLILFFKFIFKRLGADHGFLKLLGMAAVVGILWEFAEFVWDRFIWQSGFTYLAGTYDDTLSDLFFDLLGGAVGFLLIL